jgi:hypothetical protein
VSILGFDRQKLSNSNGKGKRNSKEMESGTESKANSCSKKHLPLGGAHAYLFIGEVKGLIIMS